jgi:predicted Fe-Mo cluster-binding NifX family protein
MWHGACYTYCIVSPAQPNKTRTAFSTWENRIAPVFDVARPVHLLEAEAGRILGEWQEILPDGSPVQKALCLAELGVDTLVCGAITKPLHAMIAAYGIEVIPFVAGDLQEVIQAHLKGSSLGKVFAMPGCCGGGRRRIHGTVSVALESRGSSNQCVGRGRSGPTRQGRYGRGCSRTGDPSMEETMGVCVCPQCGHKEPHQRGTPCNEHLCPKCGTVMSRE